MSERTKLPDSGGDASFPSRVRPLNNGQLLCLSRGCFFLYWIFDLPEKMETSIRSEGTNIGTFKNHNLQNYPFSFDLKMKRDRASHLYVYYTRNIHSSKQHPVGIPVKVGPRYLWLVVRGDWTGRSLRWDCENRDPVMRSHPVIRSPLL